MFGLEASVAAFAVALFLPRPVITHENKALGPPTGPTRSAAAQGAAAPPAPAPAPSVAAARRVPRSIDEVDNGAILGFAAELSEASGGPI